MTYDKETHIWKTYPSDYYLGYVVLPDFDKPKSHPSLDRRFMFVIAAETIQPGRLCIIGSDLYATRHNMPLINGMRAEYMAAGKIGICLASVEVQENYCFWVQTAGLYKKDSMQVHL